MRQTTFVLEKRHADGKLDLSAPQPPFMEATYDELARYFFGHSGHRGDSATQEEIREWYGAQNFRWRPKTW